MRWPSWRMRLGMPLSERSRRPGLPRRGFQASAPTRWTSYYQQIRLKSNGITGFPASMHKSTQALRPDSFAVIAKRFARLALFLEAYQHRSQRRHDLAARHQVLQLEVQAVAAQPAADEKRVLCRRCGRRGTDVGSDRGRTHPFGQPVMRTLKCSCSSPNSFKSVSRSSMSAGRARSDSEIARPHVGIAGQARLYLRTFESCSGRAMPCSVSSSFDRQQQRGRRRGCTATHPGLASGESQADSVARWFASRNAAVRSPRL